MSRMGLVSCTFQTARIITERFPMGMHRAKEGLFFKEERFIKDRSGIMLQKVRGF